MSRKSLLGIDLTEWNALSGLSDPYSLELAKISAEAGVPRIVISESAIDHEGRDPNAGKGGAEGDAKRKKRLDLLRKGNKPDVSPGLTKFLRKQGSMKVDDISYEGCLNAFLEDYGSSLGEFNYLLDYAVENGDLDLQDDLLAIEETLDYMLDDFAQMDKRAKEIKAKQQSATGAPAPTPSVSGFAKVNKRANAIKARQAKGVAAGNTAVQGAKAPVTKAGLTKALGMAPAPTAAPAAAASPPPAEAPTPSTAGGTPPAAPTPAAPTPGAPAPGKAGGTDFDKKMADIDAKKADIDKRMAGIDKKVAAGTSGGNTAQTAPTQPGQTKKEKEPKEPTQSSSLGKLAQGAANVFSGGVQTGRVAGRQVKKAGRKIRQGMQDQPNESVDYWEEFLDENGLTVSEYMMVVEDAYEYDDEEMIDHVHQLEGMYAAYKAKKAAKAKAKSDEQAAKMKSKWGAATDVIKKHGREAVKAASVRGIDVPKKVATGGGTTTNEAIDWMLQMSGYTDEYIEGRTKEQQWKGQSAAGGETPSGMHRKLSGPMMKRHGADLDAIDKARKTGKVTDKAKRGVRQLRKFNTMGDELAGRAARAKQGKSRLELSTTGRPKLPEAMEKMLQMSGYTDEYIEGRSKDQQRRGHGAMAKRAKLGSSELTIGMTSGSGRSAEKAYDDTIRKIVRKGEKTGVKPKSGPSFRKAADASDVAFRSANDRKLARSRGRDPLALKAKVSKNARRLNNVLMAKERSRK